MSAAQQTPVPRHGGNAVIAAALVAFCVLLFIPMLWLTQQNDGLEQGFGEMVALLLALYAYFAVGIVLLIRRPANPLGWAMTAIGVLTSLGSFSAEYATYALGATPHDVPLAVFAAWINAWWWYPTIAIVFLIVPLLFPDGRPLSRRWAWLTRVAIGIVIFITVSASLAPTLSDEPAYGPVPNPIGVALVSDIEEGLFGAISFGSLILCMLAALTSVVIRFRRSRGVERQQMKWFVAAAGALILLITVEEVSAALGVNHLLPESNVVFGVVVGLLPLAIGIAVLRYRLYEIDRIISRTLTYFVLTAVLVGLYLVAVSALTTVLAPVTGKSPFAVAVATLLAAAAFGPLRRRVQSIVDRRFNRARYDAARTVDRFRTSVRDEVDLPRLTTGLLTVVDDAVQPAATTLWLRDVGIGGS
ncbi:MAG: hypothetical protein ICV72_12185 [Aldersonia sp.]|nr:hypothetical protein [Aldersonia sp.]